MSDRPESNENLGKHVDKTPEVEIETFDDIRNTDKIGRVDTFNDLKEGNMDKSIETFDDLRKESENKVVKADVTSSEKLYPSNSSAELSFTNGRHRSYVAAREGYENVPVKLNDIYAQSDGHHLIDRRDLTQANFDKNVIKSQDLQDLRKEHDFDKWEQGQVAHKGFTYNDHVKEFGRLRDCQEAIKKGHSSSEIEGLLGKDYADTYKRFYETDPIKIDRTIKSD